MVASNSLQIFSTPTVTVLNDFIVAKSSNRPAKEPTQSLLPSTNQQDTSRNVHCVLTTTGEFDTNAEPFVPQSSSSRDNSDVLKDHAEVEKVFLGGLGTATSSSELWKSTLQPLEDSGNVPEAQHVCVALPFSGVDIPSNFTVPAKPVAKTSSLKEVKISYNNSTFIDRQLPPSTKTLTPHQRFTPTYYVALHNLVASGGDHGNGFRYPPNTPNYKGARIPLAHTGLNIKNWRKLLVGYSDCLELLQFMEFGFPLGLVEAPSLSPCSRNHGSAYQFYPHIDKFVSTEISRNGLTGPFTTPPWRDLMLSPLMTAPKKPDSRRPVFDATFGDYSLNNSTPNDCYLGTPTVYTYPKIDDFRRIVLTCGRGCFMWKRDLHRFYLQIPMDPVEFMHVGFVWRGLFFFFVALMFGLRHSGLQGQRITDALAWIHRQSGLDTVAEKQFHCINYCDDLGGAEPAKDMADLSFTKLGLLLAQLGLAESVDKARRPSTEIVYLGVQFDSLAMTMSVPPEKLAEVKEEIEHWYKKTTAAKKPLQSLLGKLFWVSRVVQHSRTFIGRLLTQLREMSGKPDFAKVQLSEDCKKDLLWWRTFIVQYNGVTMIENDDAITLPLSQLLDKPFSVCPGDATLTGGGAWYGRSYWSRQFPVWLKDPKIPVHQKEFLVVIVSTKLWGKDWAGKVVQIFCDNDPVCDVIAGERPSDSTMLSLLREFKFLVCKFRFYPALRKISTKDNSIADHISRRHDDEAAQRVFREHGLPEMSLIDAPDRHFELTAPW